MQPSSQRPLIAVVGSLDSSRTNYHPPLKNTDLGPTACRDLGRALARSNCDLAVFSSKPKYIEAWVVEGYAEASSAAAPGRVLAHLPSHAEVAFDMPSDKVMVVPHIDTSGEWELPYYQTISAADGVVVVGGGQTARIAGIVALLHRVPIVAVSAFGGGAVHVRANLDHVRNDATAEDISLMGQPWTDGIAERLVTVLMEQGSRKRERTLLERREAGRRRLAARLALTIAILLLIMSWFGVAFAGPAGSPDVRSLTFLLGTPMLASIAGALLRNYQAEDPTWGWAAARGLGAGLVTVFLYIAGELLSVPQLMTMLDPQRLLFFLVPLGFVAGFTFDLVFERLRTEQVKIPSGTPPTPVG